MASENAAVEDGMTFGELLENRRSIRRYQDRPVSVQVVQDMIRESTLAPNAGNEQPWKFGVITDPGQSQVVSSAGEFSWGGAANTKFWIDPEEDLVAVLMSQFLGSPWSDETRYNMKIATYQALTELGTD